MRRVERVAVEVRHAIEPAALDALLRTIVASLTQRLDITIPKEIEVTTMRLDMIDDRCCDHEASRLAHLTQVVAV